MSYKSSRGYWVFLIPGIVAFLVIIVIPMLANIGISFTKWRGVGDPTWIGLANYETALDDKTFWASFQNNFRLIFAMTIIPTCLGLVLAVFLFEHTARRFGQRTASFFRAGFYLPQIIPLVVAAIVWRWIYQPKWGVLNWLLTTIGLESQTRNWLGDADTALYSIMGMLVWIQIGYPLVIFMAALQRIDPELHEAASLDGASPFQRLWHITVPLIRPELFVVVLTTSIHALKVFAPVYAMTSGGPGRSTIVASYFSYRNFFERANVGYGATVATVLTAIIVALTIVFITIQTRQEQSEGA